MLCEHPTDPFAVIHMRQPEFSDIKRLTKAHSNIHFVTPPSNPFTAANSSQPWINMFSFGISSLKAVWNALIKANLDRFIQEFDNLFAEHWGEYYCIRLKFGAWR